MGNMHIVTGYKGENHVTAADVGSFNAAIFGTGQYVLNRGNKFKTTVVSNNKITVADGDLLIQGRHVRLNEGTTVDLTIENGTQGYYRNDLIVARYTKDQTTGVEDVNLVVIKGTPASSSAKDPSYTSGDIINSHVYLADMPLYRVPLDGINVGTLVTLYTSATLIADSSVTAAKIANGAVVEAKIGTGAVTNTKLGSGSVSEAKIQDGSVTFAKLADSATSTLEEIEASSSPATTLPTGKALKDSMYYYAGDTITINEGLFAATGFLTGGGKSIFFSVNLKKHISASKITVSELILGIRPSSGKADYILCDSTTSYNANEADFKNGNYVSSVEVFTVAESNDVKINITLKSAAQEGSTSDHSTVPNNSPLSICITKLVLALSNT